MIDFLPTIMHTCCILHNILLASNDLTLDEILIECHLPHVHRISLASKEAVEKFEPPNPITFVSKQRALLEGRMAHEDLLDYFVRVQNHWHGL